MKTISFIALSTGLIVPSASSEDRDLKLTDDSKLFALEVRSLLEYEHSLPTHMLVTKRIESQQTATMLASHAPQLILKYGHPCEPAFEEHSVNKINENFTEAVHRYGRPLSWRERLSCPNEEVLTWWLDELRAEIAGFLSECHSEDVVCFVGPGSIPVVLFDESSEAQDLALRPFDGVVYLLELQQAGTVFVKSKPPTGLRPGHCRPPYGGR